MVKPNRKCSRRVLQRWRSYDSSSNYTEKDSQGRVRLSPEDIDLIVNLVVERLKIYLDPDIEDGK